MIKKINAFQIKSKSKSPQRPPHFLPQLTLHKGETNIQNNETNLKLGGTQYIKFNENKSKSPPIQRNESHLDKIMTISNIYNSEMHNDKMKSSTSSMFMSNMKQSSMKQSRLIQKENQNNQKQKYNRNNYNQEVPLEIHQQLQIQLNISKEAVQQTTQEERIYQIKVNQLEQFFDIFLKINKVHPSMQSLMLNELQDFIKTYTVCTLKTIKQTNILQILKQLKFTESDIYSQLKPLPEQCSYPEVFQYLEQYLKINENIIMKKLSELTLSIQKFNEETQNKKIIMNQYADFIEELKGQLKEQGILIQKLNSYQTQINKDNQVLTLIDFSKKDMEIDEIKQSIKKAKEEFQAEVNLFEQKMLAVRTENYKQIYELEQSLLQTVSYEYFIMQNP